LHIEDVDRFGIAGVVEQAPARSSATDRPISSFDVDGPRPGLRAGHRNARGPAVLTPREAQAILRGLAGIDIVGGDVVEVAPAIRPDQHTRDGRRPDAVRAVLAAVLGPRFKQH